MNYEYLNDRYHALEYQYMQLVLTHNHVKTGIAEFLKLIIRVKKTAENLQKSNRNDPQAEFLFQLADELTEIYDNNFKEAVSSNNTNNS